jgi:hypothetical protein
MLLANVDVASLEALTNCNFNATNPPACLADQLRSLASLPEVEASDRTDDSSNGLPLRVATVVKAANGITFTLAGAWR